MGVAFEGAVWPLGNHVLRAELVAGDFSQTLTFTRIRGAFDNRLVQPNVRKVFRSP